MVLNLVGTSLVLSKIIFFRVLFHVIEFLRILGLVFLEIVKNRKKIKVNF